MANKPVYIVVTPFFPSPESWRGAYCLDFVRALDRLGRFDIRVFVPGAGPDYEVDGVVVHRFPELCLPSALFPFLFHKHNAESFLRAVRHAGINPSDVAVCHGHTVYCATYPLAIKRLNPACKTLLHHHDLASFGLNTGIGHTCWLRNVIQYPISRHFLEQIDCHVFISEASRRSFLSVPNTDWTVYEDYKRQYRGLGFYRSPRIKRSIILHNGVDTSVFHTVSPLPPRTSAAFTIGAVGNFGKLKGFDTLIRAVGEAQKSISATVRVLLVGSGPEEPLICRLAEDLDVSLEILREVRHTELAGFYHTIDLFVLPSYFEGFGCVYTEAWSCGVPFIACEGQGVTDVIPMADREKWLAKPCDAHDLGEKIVKYYAHRWKQQLTCPVDINVLLSQFAQSLS